MDWTHIRFGCWGWAWVGVGWGNNYNLRVYKRERCRVYRRARFCVYRRNLDPKQHLPVVSECVWMLLVCKAWKQHVLFHASSFATPSLERIRCTKEVDWVDVVDPGRVLRSMTQTMANQLQTKINWVLRTKIPPELWWDRNGTKVAQALGLGAIHAGTSWCARRNLSKVWLSFYLRISQAMSHTCFPTGRWPRLKGLAHKNVTFGYFLKLSEGFRRSLDAGTTTPTEIELQPPGRQNTSGELVIQLPLHSSAQSATFAVPKVKSRLGGEWKESGAPRDGELGVIHLHMERIKTDKNDLLWLRKWGDWNLKSHKF